MPTSHSRARSLRSVGLPNTTSFTKPGRPANGSCAYEMYCEYAFAMPGWLPAQPSALRRRRLFTNPSRFVSATYDADSLGKACQRSEGANVLEAS